VTVNESDGSVLIQLRRVGPVFDSVSIDVVTVDGTATG